MRKAIRRGISLALAAALSASISVDLFAERAFAANKNDFIYSVSTTAGTVTQTDSTMGAVTVPTTGATVTLNVCLPAGIAYASAGIGLKKTEAVAQNCTFVQANPLNGKDNWTGNTLAYKGDTVNYDSVLVTNLYDKSYTENTPFYSLAVTVPAGLTAGTVMNFTATPNTMSSNLAGVYFNKINSDYNTGTRVVFTITIAAADTAATAVTALDITGVAGTAITPVTATQTGGTAGGKFTATGLPTGLSINETTGEVTGTSATAVTGKYTVTYTTPGGKATTSAQANYTITAADTAATTVTALDITGVAGTAITPVTATQTGGTAGGKFTATGLPTGLSINETTGEVTGTSATAVTGKYTVTYTTPGGKATTSAQANYTITAADTAATTVTALDITGVAGTAITPVTATQTGGTAGGKFTATGLPAGLSINETTGEVTGTSATAVTGKYTVTYTTPGGKATTSAQANYTITAADTAATTVTALDITGVAGTAITSVTATQTGGTAGGKFTATGLPTGLSINETTGEVTGTSATAVTGKYTVTYTTPGGKATTSAQANYTITAADTAATTVTALDITGVAGTAITSVTATQTGGTAGGKFTATGLPTGLSINETTGEVTGTSATAVTGKYTVTYTTPGGKATTSAQANYTITAADTAATTVTALDITGVAGTAITSVTATQTGGTAGGKFTATGLPTGLSINETTGEVTGTSATAVTGKYTVTYTTPGGKATTSAQANYTITAADTAATTITVLDITGVAGTAITPVTATQTGGTAGGKFTAAGLPTGLSINETTGEVTGTSATAVTGKYTATYTTPGGKATTSAQANYTIKDKTPVSGSDFLYAVETSNGVVVQTDSTKGAATLSAAGGKVTLKVKLPANVPYANAGIGIKISGATALGCTMGTQVNPLNGKDNWTGDLTSYKGDSATYSSVLVYNTDNVTYTANTAFFEQDVTVPAGLPVGTTIDFTATPNTSASALEGVYFNKLNSTYKNGDRVVFTITIGDKYTVTYDGNGSTSGTVPVDAKSPYIANSEVTVLGNTNNLAKTDYTFQGWAKTAGAASADYTASAIAAGTAKFNITGNTTLYAVWTYNGGGGDIIVPTTPEFFTSDHIAYLYGFPDDTIRPGADMTRAQAAVVIYRLLSDETRAANKTTVCAYPDVTDGSWYETAVATLSGMGIIRGFPDGTFKPDASITRAQFAAMFARFDSSSYSGTDKFSDISGHWAANLIDRAAVKGWVEGFPDGTFRPDENITRAQAATLINRVLVRLPESVSDLVTKDMKSFADNSNADAWYYLALQEAVNTHTYTLKNDKTHETWKAVLSVNELLETVK
jgi:hypothetical protein